MKIKAWLIIGLATVSVGAGTRAQAAEAGLLERQVQLLERLAADVATLKARDASTPADRRGAAGYRALYTIKPDGTDAQFLTAAPGMISSATPDWSHDGTMVAFDCVPEVNELDQSRIAVFAVTGPFRGTTRDLGPGNTPCWSPDDRQIAFMLNPGNPAQAQEGIWVMNADGAHRRRLGHGWYSRWSPDGKEICSYAYQSERGQLHLYDARTGALRKILGGGLLAEFGGANWTPDGKRLVFIALKDGRQHLATIERDGDPASLVILYSESDRNRRLVGPPAISPDGRRIVFSIQQADRSPGNPRQWQHTYLHTSSATAPGEPVPLEAGEIGLINRGMTWSRDGSRILFSSER